MPMHFRGVSQLTMIYEKSLKTSGLSKHLARGMVCDHAKLGQEQEIFVSFYLSIFFFYYFENIESSIISYGNASIIDFY